MARKKKPITLELKRSKVPKGRTPHMPTKNHAKRRKEDWRDETGFWDGPLSPMGEL